MMPKCIAFAIHMGISWTFYNLALAYALNHMPGPWGEGQWEVLLGMMIGSFAFSILMYDIWKAKAKSSDG